MFGIGWSEFLFIAIVALLVLGPEKLPELARQLGKWMRELRAMATQLRREFQEEIDLPAERGGDPLRQLDRLTGPEDLDAPADEFGKVVRRPTDADRHGTD